MMAIYKYNLYITAIKLGKHGEGWSQNVVKPHKLDDKEWLQVEYIYFYRNGNPSPLSPQISYLHIINSVVVF